MEGRLNELVRSYGQLKIPGHVNTTVFRMDANPSELLMTVVFDGKDSYVKNADSPEQERRYRQMLELLQGEPEWHDGEVIYSGP